MTCYYYDPRPHNLKTEINPSLTNEVTIHILNRRNDWILTADSTWGEGFSTGTFKESFSKGKAIFSGELVTR